VAFGTAAGVAGLIGIVWLVGSLSMGNFALKDTSFADAVNASSAGQVVDTTTVDGSAAGLAGAAAAPAVDEKNAPAHIQIVNVTPKPTPKPEQTTIPF
ncbi:MAG: hypothetical protein RLZZ26_673, partial [Candidatus Parcubacteria bacterium]